MFLKVAKKLNPYQSSFSEVEKKLKQVKKLMRRKVGDQLLKVDKKLQRLKQLFESCEKVGKS